MLKYIPTEGNPTFKNNNNNTNLKLLILLSEKKAMYQVKYGFRYDGSTRTCLFRHVDNIVSLSG